MSKEMMIVFVYDTEICQHEADDPVKAVLYFHPSWVSDIQKLSLCGQLMGTVQFLRQSFSNPKIISLQNGKFMLKEFGRFVLVVGSDRNLSTSILEHRAELLSSMVRFFHCDIQTLSDSFANTDDHYKNLSDKLYHTFETILPILQYNGNVFQNMPISRLPKSASNIFLDSMQTLQSCQQMKGVLGGVIFYHNKVVATQLSPDITKNLVLTDPFRIKTTAESISVDFHIPIGVQLIVVFIPVKEYRKLNLASQRAQSITNQNANSIVPFQFKKKMKRDKSIIFTNIPEEGVAEADNGEVKKPSKMVTQRPNHLPLRFKNITSKDIPESGFSSINFDETDSFPQFIGKTSVSSTPMTENKILHGNIMPICANSDSPEKDETKQNDLMDKFNKIQLNKPISNFINNPFRIEQRRNSLTDLQDSLKKISKRLSIRPFGIGLTKLNKAEADGVEMDDIEIDDVETRTYRTITDPTYPVFNSDGAPISKHLFQEFLNRQEALENQTEPMNENNCTIDGFDGEMKESPIRQPKEPEIVPIPDSIPLRPNKIALNLPLKSLSMESNATNESANVNIFELPAQRKKLSGIQLTPLMTKLSILAMNDERSSGFSSWDTTPGVELSTPADATKMFRRRSSVKCEDVVDINNERNLSHQRERVEMFICGQQNMTMMLLLEENSCQKRELVQAMFDTCVSRLTRLEASLNQILNVSVDGEKSDGNYSFLSVDPHWDTLQRCGPWSNKDLEHVEHIRNDFVRMSGTTDLILRTEDTVVYGYKCGQSGIFYKQNSTIQNGLPAPADVMGTISISAKRRLERDHSIILM
ncbi:Hermansky-Pudlak syndrome 4 protein [Pseudolycoriella hygida]|uniref:Hermansky-Pudlak syndrome 4 protein n=1 Tax=Pseudolycoriella hygida TaxID=35572 RepID=A0A9Q0NH03_9DIPT|nr:Hermansky-Pudlak syndrome 4 protein [Pseudolycoriella hygida]